MKTQKIRQEDHDLIFPGEKIVRSSPLRDHAMQGGLKGHSTSLREQLALRDVDVVRRSLEQLKMRNERIEALKVQVNAGTYQMNSENLAQKMVSSPLARRALHTESYSTFAFKDEE